MEFESKFGGSEERWCPKCEDRQMDVLVWDSEKIVGEQEWG